MTPNVVDEVASAVRAHPAVIGVELVGSRANGSAGPLSDWDFKLETRDAERVFTELPAVVESFGPLAAFWDPLGERRNYMPIFRGLTKLDLHLDMEPLPARPWVVDKVTLPALDDHFWDWTLWLAGKAMKGQDDLVLHELEKMRTYLLGPLGVDATPTNLRDAIDVYSAARDQAEDDCRVRVGGRELEREVRSALAEHALV